MPLMSLHEEHLQEIICYDIGTGTILAVQSTVSYHGLGISSNNNSIHFNSITFTEYLLTATNLSHPRIGCIQKQS
jgi:hypothetical protein